MLLEVDPLLKLTKGKQLYPIQYMNTLNSEENKESMEPALSNQK